MFGLSTITGKAWQLGAVGASLGCCVLAGVLGWQTIRLADAKRTLAEERSAVLKQRIETADAWAKVLTNYQQESEGAIERHRELLANSYVDAATAADLGQRLRNEVARLRARPSCATAAAAEVGTAASAPADLPAYVQQRLDEAAERIARFADEAAAAGSICFESQQALRAKE